MGCWLSEFNSPVPDQALWYDGRMRAFIKCVTWSPAACFTFGVWLSLRDQNNGMAAYCVLMLMVALILLRYPGFRRRVLGE